MYFPVDHILQSNISGQTMRLNFNNITAGRNVRFQMLECTIYVCFSKEVHEVSGTDVFLIFYSKILTVSNEGNKLTAVSVLSLTIFLKK